MTIYRNSSGVTIVELVLAMAVGAIILGAIFTNVNPAESRARARDNKRLSELSTLDRIVIEYKLDKETYPDVEDTLRQSHILISGAFGLTDVQRGWIDANVSDYYTRQPIDPLNNETYHFSYYHDGSSYELNAVLEYNTELMQNDSGNNPNAYEIGNKLDLIN